MHNAAPWSYDANVSASLERSQDGTVTGTLRIETPAGEPPILLSATAPDAAVQWAQDMYQRLQGRAAAGAMPRAITQDLAQQYNALKAQPQMGRALKAQTSAAAALAHAVKKGDPRAQGLLRMLCMLAARGHKPAQRGRAAVSGCLNDPRLYVVAASGCGCKGVSGCDEGAAAGYARPRAPMDLHNYWTIVSGWGVDPAAAGYTPQDLSFPGLRAMWRNLRPHLGIRREGAAFGLRDALTLGMQNIRHRELTA